MINALEGIISSSAGQANDSCCVKFDNLVRGIFLQRDNRFRVQVRIDDRIATAHLPNSGRLTELLVDGSTVWLKPAAPAARPRRHTEYDLTLVEFKNRFVSVDARLPGQLVYRALCFQCLGKDFASYPIVRREVAYRKSRIDFLLEACNLRPYWIEVKSVTLVDEGIARFPDAPTSRGRRHLLELTHAVNSGDRATVIFVIQREDATCFQPNDRADPAFVQALRLATAAGVKVLALRCRINRQSALILGWIPVELN
jgi:sugar fermentation stimulation protein A